MYRDLNGTANSWVLYDCVGGKEATELDFAHSSCLCTIGLLLSMPYELVLTTSTTTTANWSACRAPPACGRAKTQWK